MDDDRQLHIDLDLRLSGEGVEGRATMAGAAPREFSGWVGLLAALDAMTAARAPDPEPR
jgi:hypothetical protein